MIKFILSPGAMVVAGYTLLESIITTSIGAIIGVTIFFFAGEKIMDALEKLFRLVFKRKKKKRVFNKTNRFIVKMKNSNGLFGLALLCVILSVPVSGILAGKYFREPLKTLPVLYLSFTTWSVLLSLAAWGVKIA